MAFYETRTIQVANDPSVIDAITNEAGTFMWQVLSQQVTDRKETHTEHESFGYDIYERVVTNSANYCTISLRRDKAMPHYDEIIRLEKELAVVRSIDAEEFVYTGEDGLRDHLNFWERLFWPIAVIKGVKYMSSIKAKDDEKKSAALEAFNADKQKRLSEHPTEDEILAQAEALCRQIISEMRG